MKKEPEKNPEWKEAPYSCAFEFQTSKRWPSLKAFAKELKTLGIVKKKSK